MLRFDTTSVAPGTVQDARLTFTAFTQPTWDADGLTSIGRWLVTFDTATDPLAFSVLLADLPGYKGRGLLPLANAQAGVVAGGSTVLFVYFDPSTINRPTGENRWGMARPNPEFPGYDPYLELCLEGQP